MQDYLGLGINLSLDDNLTRRVDPIVRDLDRLRESARRTTTSINGLRNTGDPFSSARRRNIQDYNTAMQRTDLALLGVTDRLVRATHSANGLAKATNSAQFTGNFGRMYGEVFRVNNILSQMGFGMSRMQKEMKANQAYTMADTQIKDLKDRVNQTKRALDEMQNSANSSMYTKEIALAQRALQTYQVELQRAGDLQQSLANVNGYGTTSSNVGNVMFESAPNPASLKLLGATMRDVGLASGIAYNSLSKTGDMMVGMGYNTAEAKMKLMQMTMQLTTTGMMLTQFATVPVALATSAIGMLLNRTEEAANTMQAKTLLPEEQWLRSQQIIRDIAVDTGVAEQEIASTLGTAYNSFGKNLETASEMTTRATFVNKTFGVSSRKALSDVSTIMKEFGVDSDKAWDMYVAGAIEADKVGKGNTGQAGMDRIIDTIKEAPDKFKALTNATGEFADAYQRLEDRADKGFFEGLMEGLGTGMTVLTEGMKSLEPIVAPIFDLFNDKMGQLNEYFREHPNVQKYFSAIGFGTLAFVALLGPVAMLTGFMLQYRNVIKGVAMSVAAFNKGGLAVLPPQARMAMNATKALTVAMARLPQTILLGVLPAIYSLARAFPAMLFNMAKMNPVMTGLTFGLVAYTKNWFGLKDAIDNNIRKFKEVKSAGEGIVKSLLGNEKVDMSQFSEVEKAVAKIIGTFKVGKKVIGGIFSGEEVKFSVGEINLIQSLGIEEAINAIARLGKATKDFTSGFFDGISLVFGKVVEFGGWMLNTLEPLLVRMSNFISKLFGGEGGATSLDDIVGNANNANTVMKDLGKFAGVALAALLGFKVIKPLFASMFKGLVKNPFAGIISGANRARQATTTMTTAIRNVSRTGGTRGNVGGTVTPLSNRQRRRMSANQIANHERALTNQNARNRGHRDMGTAVHGAAGQNRGRTMYARRQGVVSRALFGQAYDTFDRDGRRREVQRRGGLLRRSSNDNRQTNRLSMRDRIRDGRQGAVRRTASLGRGAVGAVGRGARAFGNTPVVSGARQGLQNTRQRIGNSRVGRGARAITIPVRYAVGRLQTAGIIRQGSNAGRTSGGRFKRAFNLAAKGLKVSYNGVTKGATTAGRVAGRGTLKGFGVVSKGIGGIFKLGLRAIPFLGWALMAWDIISTVFSNWDKIKSYALIAWEWIKENGVTVLSNAWEAIKGFASTAFNWITTDGIRMASEIAGNILQWIVGTALPTVLSTAISIFAWILTDGIAMAIDIGINILKFVGQAFMDLVGFAWEQFMNIASSAVSAGIEIGGKIFDGIKSALSGLGDWVAGAIAKVPGGSFVMEKLGVKAYAKGGIINSPHMGLVGEAGPEAIIPLSGNQRGRAETLMQRVAGVFGMRMQKVDKEDNEFDFDDLGSVDDGTGTDDNTPRPNKNSVSKNSGGNEGVSISIGDVHVHLKGENAGGNPQNVGRSVAKALAKELQVLMKQERLRGKGKNLTLEELILNL